MAAESPRGPQAPRHYDRSVRRSSIIPEILFILLGAMLGLATNYATGDEPAPGVIELIRAWSLPLVAVTIVALISVRVWQYMLERPTSLALEWDPSRSPYPGLEAFTEDEATVFRGRRREVELILERIQQGSGGTSDRFVAVIGPSGSGKSSLLHAGVVAHLAPQRRRWAVLPSFVPERQPMRQLAAALASVLSGESVGQLTDRLHADHRSVDDSLQHFRAARGGRARVLIVIDQAEELFTLSGPQERDDFMRLIEQATRRNPWLWVLASLRSEFLTAFLNSPFASIVQQPIAVGFLDRSALFEVVGGPAMQAGVTFEPPTLVNRIVDDAGTGEALPLLAYTLFELWRRADGRKTITSEDYQAIGGVEGALIKQANRVIGELASEGITEHEVLACLLRLVTLEGGTATGRRVRRDWLNKSERQIADAFIEARLLTGDDDTDGHPAIRVAHESLIEMWPPLRREVDAQVADLQLQTRVERWAEDWAEAGRLDGYLLNGERLRAVVEWSESAGPVTPTVRELIEASRAADRATVVRAADAVANRALECVARDPELAIQAVLAASKEYELTPLCRQVLTSSLAVSRLRIVLPGRDGPVGDVAWSPDSVLLAASAGSIVRLWDVARRTVSRTLAGHVGPIRALSWHPSRPCLASASEDGSVRLWSLDAPGGALTLGAKSLATSVAWSPSGDHVLVGHADGTIRIWLAEVAETVAEWRAPSRVNSVAWSPDGNAIAAGGDDRVIRVWFAPFDEQPLELTGHQRPVTALAWSPDGTTLASGSEDWGLARWSPVTGTQLAGLHSHDVPVTALAWSPDGTRIVTGTTERRTMVWDPSETVPLSDLRGHDGVVTGVSWSPDGTEIATSGQDGTVRIWSAALPQLRHGRLTRAVAWAPDDRFLASASADKDVRIWDTAVGLDLGTLAGHKAEVYHLAWSPNGQWIASCGRDGVVRLWDARTRAMVHELADQTGPQPWVAWSTDSRTLASASMSGTVYLWNAEKGEVNRRWEFPVGTTWVGWSPDGGQLAIVLWDARVFINDQTSGDRVELRGHTDDVWAASWSPNGTRIATCSFDGTIRLWDTATGTEVGRIHGHAGQVFAVAWSPGVGSWLASVGSDRTVRLWDVADLREVAVLSGHNEPIWGLNWSHDGSRLVTSSDDGVIRVWDVTLSTDSAVSLAEGLGLRDLSAAERARFGLPSVATLVS